MTMAGTLVRATLVLRNVGLVATILSAVTGEGTAQDADLFPPAMLGTFSIDAKPSFADGQLSGCALEFSVLAKDWVYKQGAYIRVGGSFGVMGAGGKTAVVLKVILHDFDPRILNFTPSPPASAYFVAGNSTTKNAIVASYPSDVPGAIFVIFQMDPTFLVLSEGIANNKVVIGFARNKGGSDIGIAIDTTVVDTAANGKRTHSEKPTLDFLQCAKTLFQQTGK